MKPDVTINGISMDSLGWLRESISFPPVQSQTDAKTIPGRSSPIRFSVVNDRISYKPRTFKIVLTMLGYRDRFLQMVSDASQRFAGVLSKVTITEKPDLYTYGTLQLASEYNVNSHKGTLTISCSDADAFFYHNELTVQKQTGSGSIILTNDFMPVVPTVTLTKEATLAWKVGDEDFSKELSAGSWTVPELELHQGENSITIATEGEVTFEYREGCL
ncbi:hypothetical protein [Ileibacterium valens]|uniref:hypothetical protein n=1 Tax=Ileibacterium valens TaxID=1862668 RepID=UPI0027299978|nr:hypothetical protein [Ileibacterium valens]